MKPEPEPARIAPLPASQWDDRLSRLLSAAPGGDVEPMHIFTTLAHQPDLFRRWLGFGGALLDGHLPGRLRELVILRTAARFNGRYEWAHHLDLGAAQGITPAELEALGGSLSTVEWDPLERAALAAEWGRDLNPNHLFNDLRRAYAPETNHEEWRVLRDSGVREISELKRGFHPAHEVRILENRIEACRHLHHSGF